MKAVGAPRAFLDWRLRGGRAIITCSSVYLPIKENDLLTEVCAAIATAVQ